MDRPKRPTTDESFLLDEFCEMTHGQVDAMENILQYCDELEAYADSLGTGPDSELSKLRYECGSQRNEIASLNRTIDALSEAMGDKEREEWQGRVAERDQSLQALSQELAFLQVQLGGIKLILR